MSVHLRKLEDGAFTAQYYCDRLVIEDNYSKLSPNCGTELFVSIQEGVRGDQADNETAVALTRDDAERLRDWLNEWLS